MKYPDEGIDGIIVLGGSYDSVSHAYASVSGQNPTKGLVPVAPRIGPLHSTNRRTSSRKDLYSPATQGSPGPRAGTQALSIIFIRSAMSATQKVPSRRYQLCRFKNLQAPVVVRWHGAAASGCPLGLHVPFHNPCVSAGVSGRVRFIDRGAPSEGQSRAADDQPAGPR
jgi:hypothetical protein